MADNLDLYDNIGDEEFKNEDVDNDDEGSVKNEGQEAKAGDGKPASNGQQQQQQQQHGRKVAMYVGNLTWWTTDEDLLGGLQSVGVTDIVEIKFHENRSNGQSRGFCVVVVGSEQSSRVMSEKLPKLEIHGQHPVVTACNKQTLQYFENQAGGNGRSRDEPPSQQPPPQREQRGGQRQQPGYHPQHPMQPRPPPLMSAGPPMQPMQPQYQQQRLPMMQQPGLPPPRPGLPPQPMMRPMMMPPNQAPAGLQRPGVPPTAPHINPAFLPRPGQPMPHQLDMYGRPIAPVYMPQQPPQQQVPQQQQQQQQQLPQQMPLQQQQPQQPQQQQQQQQAVQGQQAPGGLSDADVEEILVRNKTVCSSAISRAVQDAAAGDYAAAIETLVTAISLIKQSKLAGDDRCAILINSLQDTLHGIESKSYGSRQSRGHRRRSYSRSASDEEPDERPSKRSRSRSREAKRRRSSRDRHERYEYESRRHRR